MLFAINNKLKRNLFFRAVRGGSRRDVKRSVIGRREPGDVTRGCKHCDGCCCGVL